jgi:hypothetical protein
MAILWAASPACKKIHLCFKENAGLCRVLPGFKNIQAALFCWELRGIDILLLFFFLCLYSINKKEKNFNKYRYIGRLGNREFMQHKVHHRAAGRGAAVVGDLSRRKSCGAPVRRRTSTPWVLRRGFRDNFFAVTARRPARVGSALVHRKVNRIYSCGKNYCAPRHVELFTNTA